MNYQPVRPHRSRRLRWKAVRLVRRVRRWALALLWPVGTAAATAVWWARNPDLSWWQIPLAGVLFAVLLGAALIPRRGDDRRR